MPLPPLPIVTFVEDEDLTPPGADGFLKLRRQRLRARYADGCESAPFVYDRVHRDALDAVVIAAHFVADGARWVYLRTALRPPVALRPPECRPLPERETLGCLWELPAGLVEPYEVGHGELGLKRCAARELHEELGFAVDAERMASLGPATFPSGGVIGERHHYFHVDVDPDSRGQPSEDGSVLERGAVIAAVKLAEAVALCRRGDIEDGKTEIALRRLSDLDP